MGACLVADWARDKRALFDAAMPDSALPVPAGQLAPGGFEPAYAPMPIRAPGAMPGAGSLQEPPIHAVKHTAQGMHATLTW